MFGVGDFWARKQGNHQNFDPSLLINKLLLVFMGMKQKIFQNRQFSIIFR